VFVVVLLPVNQFQTYSSFHLHRRRRGNDDDFRFRSHDRRRSIDGGPTDGCWQADQLRSGTA
jgi:hypothetical protein